MINPTGKKLEKIIFKLFDDASQGVDRYNHNGSLWAIFTNEMKWVVEYTKDQTLWYNYSFFKDEMELVSLDCVEDKDLIKKWFESRFLGIPKVEDFCEPFFDQDQYVEDTIQNGVKQTELSKRDFFPKDILQNGVKETKSLQIHLKKSIKDTIQKGVRHTRKWCDDCGPRVEDTIQNGVRMTKSTIISQDSKVEDTIQNGVKETIGTLRRTCKWGVDDIIKNGVKETKTRYFLRNLKIEDTIQDKEKDTQLLPIEQSVYVENIIQNGVKHTEDGDWLDGDERFNNIIQNGVKETYDDCSNNIARVEGIVRIGEKIS